MPSSVSFYSGYIAAALHHLNTFATQNGFPLLRDANCETTPFQHHLDDDDIEDLKGFFKSPFEGKMQLGKYLPEYKWVKYLVEVITDKARKAYGEFNNIEVT